MKLDRAAAWALLVQYTQNENLLRHSLAVEVSMRAYAERFGEDVEKWGMVGLLHDFDYEKFPSEHPMKGVRILEELGYDEDIVHAIAAHADFSGVPRVSLMDRALFGVDELCGFITAATLVRPGKNIGDLPPSSVRKRMKDKAFARAVNRDDIVRGAEDLGVGLDEHIALVISAMSGIAWDLGLAGEAQLQ